MPTSAVTFSRYDTADYLETEQDIAAYLDAIAEDDDPALLLAALDDVARARNLSPPSAHTGLGQRNPSYVSVAKTAHALGLKIRICAV